MNKAREEVTKEMLNLLSKFAGKTKSVELFEEAINNLSDDAFDKYMQALQSEEEVLPYVVPNMGNYTISVDTNLKIAEELGCELFQRLWLTDSATGEEYLTPKKYLVVDLPIRRMIQTLDSKISIPNVENRTDELTGQAQGDSQSSRLSFPELQVLYSQGYKETIRELFKFRGGDTKAYKNLVENIMRTGEGSMDQSEDPTSRARSVDILSILLKSAHIDNTL